MKKRKLQPQFLNVWAAKQIFSMHQHQGDIYHDARKKTYIMINSRNIIKVVKLLRSKNKKMRKIKKKKKSSYLKVKNWKSLKHRRSKKYSKNMKEKFLTFILHQSPNLQRKTFKRKEKNILIIMKWKLKHNLIRIKVKFLSNMKKR